MLPKIDKILYATDLSPNSEYVLRYAVNSAIRHDARIVILSVIEVLPPTAQTLLSTYVNDDLQHQLFEENKNKVTDRIKEKLQMLCKEGQGDGLDAEDRIEAIDICQGYPADVILDKADALDCDVIIMGSHGKGIISQTFLGSVSKRVLRRTWKPVFIIPLPEETSE